MGCFSESACYHCPECVRCGRNQRFHKVWFCDRCSEETDELYEGDNGDQICIKCLLKQYPKMMWDSTNETTLCSNCKYDAENLYLVDGVWLCEDCIIEDAEKIDTGDY